MKKEAMKTVIGQGGEATNDEGVLLTMSTLTKEGVISVKNAACERVLNQRVELKMKLKKINECLNHFHIALPKPRDSKERPPCIPQAVLEAKSKQATEKEKRSTERDLENENGGAGVYSASLKKHYILTNDEWKKDVMPEILDGYNVCDFVDPDIFHRLKELEQEGLRHEEQGDDDFEMDALKLTPEEQKMLAEIRKKRSMFIQQHRIKKTRSRSVSKGRKRERSADGGDTDGGDAMDMDVDAPNKKQCMLSRSCSCSRSRPPTEVVPGEGFKDSSQKAKAIKKARKSNTMRNRNARRREADRVIPTLKPKHLFPGKRSIGKTQRR
ncbi:hypothetical protein ACFX2C_003874 [Malus domestica]